MRSMYGGARLPTALRRIVLSTLHPFCIVRAIATAAALAVIA